MRAGLSGAGPFGQTPGYQRLRTRRAATGLKWRRMTRIGWLLYWFALVVLASAALAGARSEDKGEKNQADGHGNSKDSHGEAGGAAAEPRKGHGEKEDRGRHDGGSNRGPQDDGPPKVGSSGDDFPDGKGAPGAPKPEAHPAGADSPKADAADDSGSSGPSPDSDSGSAPSNAAPASPKVAAPEPRSAVGAPLPAADDSGALVSPQNGNVVDASLSLPSARTAWWGGTLGLVAVAILSAGAGALGSQVFRGRPRWSILGLHPPSSPPIPPTPALSDLVLRVRANPLDGEARLQLGLELVRSGQVEAGAGHLSRSFRLYPPGIMRVLEDPDLQPIRDLPEVRQVLRRFQREHQQRMWTGYA